MNERVIITQAVGSHLRGMAFYLKHLLWKLFHPFKNRRLQKLLQAEKRYFDEKIQEACAIDLKAICKKLEEKDV